MARIETGKKTVFKSMSYHVRTPEGMMYVIVMHEDMKPVGIQVNIGKAGTTLAAWANAMSRVISLAFDHGASIPEIVQELSLQSSDRVSFNSNNVRIRSGPEGLAFALLRFQEEKNEHDYSDDGEEREYRAPRFNLRRAGS